MLQQACTFATPHRRGSRGKLDTLRYLRFLPFEYGVDPKVRWPLILFLHGAGERGHDLKQLLSHGLPKLVEEQEDFPFIVISPQCPEGSFWYRQLGVLSALVEHAAGTLAVDPSRIYLTGLSMGGFGTWHLAARHPGWFAAIVPICGGGLASHGFPGKVRALRDVPVWSFHGALDTIVRPEESQRLVDELRSAGGRVEHTLYPDAKHDSWTRTYENPALYEWLLSHRRKLPSGERISEPPPGNAQRGPRRPGSRR